MPKCVFYNTLLKALIVVCMMGTASVCTAQKAFKEIRASLKAKKYSDAISKIDKLRQDTAYRDDLKLCLYRIEALRGLNDAENTKIYLKKTYDTLSFFSTTKQLIEEGVRIDSLQSSGRDSLDRFTYKEYSQVKSLLQQYYPNLNVGGRHFYRKQDYIRTMQYLRTSIDLQHSALGRHIPLVPKVSHNATVYLTSAYLAKKYAEVLRYEDEALEDEKTRELVMEYLAVTQQQLGDTATYRRYMQRGWETYPANSFFFTHLADYYTQQKDYHTLCQIASRQREAGHTIGSALFAESLAHFNLQQYDSCIVDARRLLEVDTANVEAHYYIGASYAAKALAVSFPDGVTSGAAYRKALQSQRALYQKAEPELEAYRALRSADKALWAPLLYKVYFTLNRGKKFEEIEKILAQP